MQKNFSAGGEIPNRLGQALMSNENSLKKFILSDTDKKNRFINNSRRISSLPELECYVQSMGESHCFYSENIYNLYE